MASECAVCNVLLKTCKELGDREFCAKLIGDLEKDKLTEEELINKITERFGPDKFDKTWNKTVENELSNMP